MYQNSETLMNQVVQPVHNFGRHLRDIRSSPEVLYCQMSRTENPRPIINNQLGTDTVTANYSTEFI